LVIQWGEILVFSPNLLPPNSNPSPPPPFRQNSKDCRDLFHISDDRDDHDNHDYHSSEILSDNREIAIIALAKKVALIAIITSNKKR
jgi:hypothetical protein